MTARKAQRARIYIRDGGLCRRCGKEVPYDAFDLGHIIARAYGGDSTDSNLSVEHKRCNRVAGQRMRQPGVGGLPHAEVWRG